VGSNPTPRTIPSEFNTMSLIDEIALENVALLVQSSFSKPGQSDLIRSPLGSGNFSLVDSDSP